MKNVKISGTFPEMAIRHRLHRAGYRYRVQYRVSGLPRRTIDIAFPSMRLAIFVDGCFWHGCIAHRPLPKSNADWWSRKILENKTRDADTSAQLKRLGWEVVRLWEHEDLEEMFDVICVKLAVLRRGSTAADNATRGEPHRG